MAKTPEARVKDAIKKVLGEFGCYQVMYVPVGYGANKGTPDFLVCVPPHGRFVGIEAKAGKGKTTALQDLTLNNIRSAGGEAWVIYEDDIELLRKKLHEMQIGE